MAAIHQHRLEMGSRFQMFTGICLSPVLTMLSDSEERVRNGECLELTKAKINNTRMEKFKLIPK